MENFALGCIGLSFMFAEMRKSGEVLNEFEYQLYESASSYLATFLKFQRVIMQASILEAESKLDEKVE